MGHEKSSSGLEPKHDCQLLDITVVTFVLIANDNAMFSTDLWYFRIDNFTMVMLQFLFSLFSFVTGSYFLKLPKK